MKGDTEVVLMIVFFIAGAVFMAYVKDLSAIPYMNSLLGATATLAAAFFGAKYAFKLQLASLEHQTINEQVEAGNKAIFELVRTYNQFLAVRNQFIEEHRKNPGRHIYIMPMAAKVHVMQLNFDSLAFLFDTEDPNLLGRLAMFQQEVVSTIDVIAERSTLHVEVIQPTVETLEKQFGEVIKLDQLENSLGKRTTKTLKMLTDFMINGVDEVITGAEEHIYGMSRLLNQKFSGHKIIGMIKPNKSMQQIPKNGTADA